MYLRRIVDDELDEVFPHLAAIALEGPRGVGKSATAERRANTSLHLDDPAQIALLDADPGRLNDATPPVLIDEWQRLPRSWDLVRRSVDANPRGGRFLLTGSAAPVAAPAHSGAGRIVRLRMRPLSLAERALPEPPTVSLAELLTGQRSAVSGHCSLGLRDYTEEIVASGFPGIRPLAERARVLQLDSYLARLSEVDFEEQGHRVNRPATLRAWLEAYAAATSTTASYNTILDAATPGDSNKPAQATTAVYRDVLTKLWMLEPLPGWIPSTNRLLRLAQRPKHHLADPALAARLLGASAQGLLNNETVGRLRPSDGLLLGQLFESLVVLSVRAYAQPAGAQCHHLRTQDGAHEVDLIVEGSDRRAVAIETKLSASVEDGDLKHLKWLAERLGPRLADAVVVTTGRDAYRRPDGIAVVPAALLGP
jgi:predicted AAA+ superfamily ATPase